MEKTILEILACPICKGKLVYDAHKKELICNFDKVAFPIRDEVPIMLVDQARDLSKEEVEA